MRNVSLANRCAGRIMYIWSQLCCTETMVKLVLRRNKVVQLSGLKVALTSDMCE